MSDALKVNTAGAVTTLHLDDGKANALGFELIESIRDALAAAESDPNVGAVVIHGRPGRFSGGFDLGVMLGDDFPAIVDLVAAGGELVHTAYGCGVPVIAACTGHSVAAGALLLLGCDVRVGPTIDAKIGLNEVAIKMVLPDWAFTIARERLSNRHFHRAVANARLTTPAAAVDVGFLDEVVAEDQVLPRAQAMAAELAETLDPTAYAGTLEMSRAGTIETMAAQVATARSTAQRLRTDDPA